MWILNTQANNREAIYLGRENLVCVYPNTSSNVTYMHFNIYYRLRVDELRDSRVPSRIFLLPP